VGWWSPQTAIWRCLVGPAAYLNAGGKIRIQGALITILVEEELAVRLSQPLRHGPPLEVGLFSELLDVCSFYFPQYNPDNVLTFLEQLSLARARPCQQPEHATQDSSYGFPSPSERLRQSPEFVRRNR
jgi:hypothetical protein